MSALKAVCVLKGADNSVTGTVHFSQEVIHIEIIYLKCNEVTCKYLERSEFAQILHTEYRISSGFGLESRSLVIKYQI